jgi:CHAT domain-containing protein
VQRRRSQPASIVHLATHTKFEAGTPEASFIIFADDKLFFNDFRRLEFSNPPVELLVLSSCTSALSAADDRAELGFAGLSVQAGVKSSLASLWEVNDFGTLGLMVEFYSQLQTAPIKAEALRRAQLAMIDGDVALDEDNLIWSSGMTRLSFNPRMPNTESLARHLLSHPGYWAGFTIVGNPW